MAKAATASVSTLSAPVTEKVRSKTDSEKAFSAAWSMMRSGEMPKKLSVSARRRPCGVAGRIP